MAACAKSRSNSSRHIYQILFDCHLSKGNESKITESIFAIKTFDIADLDPALKVLFNSRRKLK